MLCPYILDEFVYHSDLQSYVFNLQFIWNFLPCSIHCKHGKHDKNIDKLGFTRKGKHATPAADARTSPTALGDVVHVITANNIVKTPCDEKTMKDAMRRHMSTKQLKK